MILFRKNIGLVFLLTTLAFSQQPQWRLAKGSDSTAILDLDYFKPNPDTVIALGAKALFSADKGERWTNLGSYQYLFYKKVRFHPTNSRLLYINEESQLTGSNRFYITNLDTGGIEIFLGRGISSLALAIDYSDKHTVYVGVDVSLLRTIDGWKEVKDVTPPGGYVRDIAIAPSNDSIIVAVCELEAYKSTNKGNTWQKIFNIGDPVRVTIHPYDPNIIYLALISIGGSPRGVYKTTDGGTTWREMNNGLDSLKGYDWYWWIGAITLNPKRPNEVYLGTAGNGIFRSTDEGEHWCAFSDGLGSLIGVTTIVVDTLNDRIYAGLRALKPTDGVYIYDGKPTGVKEDKTQLITTFSLRQNYPNPFNPTTVIRYQLAVSGRVTLKVYDILGREVATLVDGYEPAGTHAVEFNGSNRSSGIYIYRLTSDKFTDVKKMVLQK